MRAFFLRSLRHVFGLAVGLAAPFAFAASIALEPVKDNVMSQDDGNYASGAGGFLFIGNIASGGARRSLLQFNLSAIPPGATVTSVSLRFSIVQTALLSGQDPVTLHRVTADWGEGTSDGGTGGGLTLASPGDATWLYQFYGNPPGVPRISWTMPGGDFAPTASAATTVGGDGTYTIPSTPQLVADVQGWLNQPATNFGWIMRGEESRSRVARKLTSRTAAAAAERPLLTVEYTPDDGSGGPPSAQVPLPGAAVIVLGAAIGAIGMFASSRRGPRRLGARFAARRERP